METTDRNSDNAGKSIQIDEPQIERNKNDKEQKLLTNFLELDKPNKGKHSIVLVYPPGQKRGVPVANIYISYEGDPKQAVFTVKDLSGIPIYAPTTKLYELKKLVKEDSIPLLEQALLGKNARVKEKPKQKKEESLAKTEALAIGNKLVDEGLKFGGQATKIVTGIDRGSQLTTIRSKKLKSKSVNRSR